ncbi:MAG: AAA family ATPase, partial [Candidatus Riflebacteria bacterium]|nr:AAA family ATPase [Candidatus Riflebacteria bacterium]
MAFGALFSRRSRRVPVDAQEHVQKISDARNKIIKELSKIIVGQEEIIEGLLIALFSRGHSILIGVPGLAKTLLINTLARIIDLRFKRIQFTPDLMP